MATPGLSVWVVDDDESVRWVLEQALKQAHMFPRAFETGEEFFGALQHGRPDVLITDIRMPDMSGLELMERLTRTDPDIPVIVITAHSNICRSRSTSTKPSSSSRAQHGSALAEPPSKRPRSRRRASSARRRPCRKSSKRSGGCRDRA